jgi:hypothetical protein
MSLQRLSAGFSFAGMVLLLASDAWAVIYSVGTNQTYTSIGAVPWESLNAGDVVRIHYRATPYREKWVIGRQGTSTNWIVVQGVPDAQGNRPVIDGSNATTRVELNYLNDERGVIQIGGSTVPADVMPQYIRIENLDVKSGRIPFTFTDDDGTAGKAYVNNSAAIFISKGENITISNCVIRDSGNGLFCGTGSNILVESCWIYGNGNEGSAYEHNNYTTSKGITFQYNYFGPLRNASCQGSNLKDRSSGCVIRYNWIESGNRQLDLVDAGDAAIYNDPAYRSTYVYGNVLVEPEDPNSRQICHYGGDSGVLSQYRQGTLYFYNNTVISTRDGSIVANSRTTLMNLSSSNETADCRNNIVYVTATGDKLEINAANGRVNLRNNWIKTGWVNSFASGVVSNLGGNISGTSPGFVNATGQVYELVSTSACVNVATSLPPAALPAHNITNEYVKHRSVRFRYSDGALDMGAYEFNPDVDYDGMPDDWERIYFTSLTNMTATSDTDGDRFPDWQEYVAGTLPTNPGSRLVVTGVKSARTNLVLTWQSVSNRQYSIAWRTNLMAGTWSPVVSNIPGVAPVNVRTVSVDKAGSRFYRVQVE